jgi:flagellar basal-body rod protein FlgB
MEPINLFDLASRKSAWLAARQATVAANVANVNTPGYVAKDVSAFNDVLAKTRLEMASTDVAHIGLGGSANAGETVSASETDNFDVTESGNSVGLEQEMIKAGDVNREFALTTNIVKSFHAMLMASLKG